MEQPSNVWTSFASDIKIQVTWSSQVSTELANWKRAFWSFWKLWITLKHHFCRFTSFASADLCWGQVNEQVSQGMEYRKCCFGSINVLILEPSMQWDPVSTLSSCFLWFKLNAPHPSWFPFNCSVKQPCMHAYGILCWMEPNRDLNYWWMKG